MKPILGGIFNSNKNPGKIIKNTSEVKYSDLLAELVSPYLTFYKDEPLSLLDLGVAAWNFSVYKKSLNKDEIKVLKTTIEKMLPKEEVKQFETMIAEKEKKYSQHNILMRDYELIPNDDGESSTLNVISSAFDGTLYNLFPESMTDRMMEEDDDDFDEFDEFGFSLAAPSAVIVTPLQPFNDWLKKIYFPEEPPVINESDKKVYLIQDENIEKWVKKNFDRLFCHELNEWDSDAGSWPQKRNLKMFYEWFSIKTHEMVFDAE